MKRIRWKHIADIDIHVGFMLLYFFFCIVSFFLLPFSSSVFLRQPFCIFVDPLVKSTHKKNEVIGGNEFPIRLS